MAIDLLPIFDAMTTVIPEIERQGIAGGVFYSRNHNEFLSLLGLQVENFD